MAIDEPGRVPGATGAALVAAQFALIAVLAAWAAPAVAAGTAPVGAWALWGASVALGVWSLAHNRPGRFNIRPTPHPRGRLVETGPYALIRHPMYSAVMLFALGCVAARLSPWPLLAAAALAAVLVIKAGVEEAAMSVRYPDYAAYRRRSKRFVPGIY